MAWVSKGKKFMDVVTYTGNGDTQTIDGLGFSPDLVWIKSRTAATGHILNDTIRGAGSLLSSQSSGVESGDPGDFITSFDSNGFTVNTTFAGGTNGSANGGSNTFVAWCWDAGDNDPVTNNDGTIESTVKANPDAGFSIATWTGNGVAGATVGHGLGVAPAMIITKDRTASKNWCVYHVSTGPTNILLLNLTDGTTVGDNYYNTTPTSTVFYNHAGNPSFDSQQNIDGNDYVSYCWAPVAGYSAFGTYTGNGDVDGPFIYTGFKPRWILIKNASTGGLNWRFIDTERSPFNPMSKVLYPNVSNAEATSTVNQIDALSNGFKIRGDGTGSNTSGDTLIYAAFAEHPVKQTQARQVVTLSSASSFDKFLEGDKIEQYAGDAPDGILDSKDVDNSQLTIIPDDPTALFTAGASNTLTKPVTPPSNKRWTWCAWVKRSELGTLQTLFSAETSKFYFDTDDKLKITSGSSDVDIVTTQVFRDASSWMHLTVSSNTISGEGVKVYVNEEQITDLDTNTQPAVDYSWDFNTTGTEQVIGNDDSANYYSGYLADIQFVDGQALVPSDFVYDASFREDQLYPKRYGGWYGTRGYRLGFSDTSSVTTFASDQSGNEDNWLMSVPGGPYLSTTFDGQTVTGGYTDSATTNATMAMAGNEVSMAPGNSITTNNLVTVDTTTFKYYGASLKFEDVVDNTDTGSYLVYDTVPAANDSNWTFETWAYAIPFTGLASGSRGQWIIFYGEWAHNRGFGVSIRYDYSSPQDGYELEWIVGNNSIITLTSTTNFTANEWNHLTVMSKDNYVYFFINGVPAGGGSRVNYTAYSTNYKFIGTYRDSNYGAGTRSHFSGYLNDLGWYTYAKYPTTGFSVGLDGSPQTFSVVDTPNNYGDDNGLGGEVRGNYATLNPLDIASVGSTLSDGNLNIIGQYTSSDDSGFARGTIGVDSGKWYWEVTIGEADIRYDMIGVATSEADINSWLGSDSHGWGYYGPGALYNQGSGGGSADGYVTGDVIGVALDVDAGTLQYYKNGVAGGSFNNLTPATYFPAAGPGAVGVTPGVVLCNDTLNFGQQPFAYPAPVGFKALNTTNLEDGLVNQGSRYMDVVTYTGNGGTQTIDGLSFSPDFVWIKQSDSNNSASHVLVDTVRGNNNVLRTNGADAENAAGIDPAEFGGITNLSTNSFDVTAGASLTYQGTNGLDKTYVAWCWDAGDNAPAVNTAGTITSTVKANPTAGFSIVTYEGTGANATVGHGLGVAPKLIICKTRTSAVNWIVYHGSLGTYDFLRLNTTDVTDNNSTVWNTAPTSTVFGIGSANGVNQDSDEYVAYCFAPVDGYSSFGSYTGSGNTDGPFVYTGFRPAYILIKKSSAASDLGWFIYDYKTSPYNFTPEALLANSSVGTQNLNEGTGGAIDILSNGFKLRGSYTDVNASGATFIYAAFAENPTQYLPQ